MTQQEINEAAEEYEYTDGIYGFKQAIKWQLQRTFDIMEQYAEFCVKCDREKLPLLNAKDWFEKFKNK